MSLYNVLPLFFLSMFVLFILTIIYGFIFSILRLKAIFFCYSLDIVVHKNLITKLFSYPLVERLLVCESKRRLFKCTTKKALLAFMKSYWIWSML